LELGGLRPDFLDPGEGNGNEESRTPGGTCRGRRRHGRRKLRVIGGPVGDFMQEWAQGEEEKKKGGERNKPRMGSLDTIQNKGKKPRKKKVKVKRLGSQLSGEKKGRRGTDSREKREVRWESRLTAKTCTKMFEAPKRANGRDMTRESILTLRVETGLGGGTERDVQEKAKKAARKKKEWGKKGGGEKKDGQLTPRISKNGVK